MTDINPDPESAIETEYNEGRARIADRVNLGSWWTWTQSDFSSWCDANLMTDAAIDALTLNASLKTNLKANNTFVRNAGSLLIVTRNIIKWLVRKV